MRENYLLFDPDLEDIATLLATVPISWGFCGGWAIDLFLNRMTRSHKDVDIAVLRADQYTIFDFLRQGGWMLEKAVNGILTPLQENEFLMPPIHTIWCRNVGSHPDFLEMLLNESEGDEFLFRRDCSISCPLNKAFIVSASGFPILAPEIVLLYKSSDATDEGNRLDFQLALPMLNIQRRRWLAGALNKFEPEHEWIRELVEQ